MPQRVNGRDLGRDNVFGQYMDSLSRDEYHELSEEYYRVGPLSEEITFEDRLLEMVPDIEEFYDIYHEKYDAGSCDYSWMFGRNLTEIEPDIIVAHDVIMQRLFVEDRDADPEIGRNKGPQRYRTASGTDSFADDMGSFGFGRGGPNVRGRLTRYGHGYGGPSGSYGYRLPHGR